MFLCMPQVVRCQVTLNPAAETRSQYVNTWHIVTVGATTPLAAATAYHTALNGFYQAVDVHLSGLVLGAVPLVRYFDLSDPKPRQPIYESTLSALSNSGSTSAPELACCISYKGTYLSGVSPKRKRGRIYLGPLKGACIDTGTGKLDSTMVTAFATAADTMITTSTSSSEWRWVVYSPTSDPTGEGNDADCWDAAVSGWVDDEVDIQRRRSLKSVGSKTLFAP